MAIKVSKKILVNNNIEPSKIDLIIVATTSSKLLMPGIAQLVQKALDIKECIGLDLLCDCGGYPNAIDIAQKYIALEDAKRALVIGVEKLSEYIDKEDINSAVLFGDGAGVILLEASDKKGLYKCKIRNIVKGSEILTCDNEIKKLNMDGTKVSLKKNDGTTVVSQVAPIQTENKVQNIVVGSVKEVKITKRKGPIGIGEGIATVNGQVAAKGELTFAIV